MKRFLIAAAVTLTAGCAPAKVGRLEANRFQHEAYPYAVFYEPQGGPLTPLGGSWPVQNYEMPHGTTRYAPKTGDEFAVARSYDLDGNGSVDVTQRELFYDLLLEHKTFHAMLWVRTVPIAVADKDTALSVLAERYVASAGSTGQVAARLGAEAAGGAVAPKLATRVVHTQPCSLSKREAYRIDFELADDPPAAVSSGTDWERGSLVLVRSGYEKRVKDPKSGRYADYPVLMLLGMQANPKRFEGLEPAFERLLARTVLGDRGQGLSMVGEHTCGRSAATSGAEQAPSSPEAAPGAGSELAPEPAEGPAPSELAPAPEPASAPQTPVPVPAP